jgi:hypothetical protein
MLRPPSGSDEPTVLHLLPPNEETARSQLWSAVTVDDELSGLRVDLDRSGEVEVLCFGVPGGI